MSMTISVLLNELNKKPEPTKGGTLENLAVSNLKTMV